MLNGKCLVSVIIALRLKVTAFLVWVHMTPTHSIAHTQTHTHTVATMQQVFGAESALLQGWLGGLSYCSALYLAFGTLATLAAATAAAAAAGAPTALGPLPLAKAAAIAVCFIFLLSVTYLLQLQVLIQLEDVLF